MSQFRILSSPGHHCLADTPTFDHDNALLCASFYDVLRHVYSSNGFSIVAFKEEKEGRDFANVIPVKGFSDEHSNKGTVMLGYHTDGPHRDDFPEYTALYCVRNEPEAYTTIVSLNDILPLIPTEEIETLKRPLFLHHPSPSWIGDRTSLRPILFEVDGVTHVRTDIEMTTCIDDDGKKAFDAFKLAVSQAKKSRVMLETGDILIVSNTRALHAREAFKSSYDSSARWLVRSYLNDKKNPLYR